jgi:signal transduction histidine kinase
MSDMAGNAAAPPVSPAIGAVEQFAAHCAHDFNNLLTGILGNLELMQNRAKRSGINNFDGYLEGARNAAGRAADFSQRLLAFSGRAAAEPAPVPVNSLALDIVELMREQNVIVAVLLAADAGAAFCDAAQLELVLLELIANARDATQNGGGITLRTAAAGGATIVTVADTGAGMTAEILARATEPFFTTRPNGAGKGLGLPIAANFCRHAGGALHLNSAPGAGTTVSLTLPQAGPD